MYACVCLLYVCNLQNFQGLKNNLQLVFACGREEILSKESETFIVCMITSKIMISNKI